MASTQHIWNPSTIQKHNRNMISRRTGRLPQAQTLLSVMLLSLVAVRSIEAFVPARYPYGQSQLHVVTPPKTSRQPSWLLDDNGDYDSNDHSTNPFLEVNDLDGGEQPQNAGILRIA